MIIDGIIIPTVTSATGITGITGITGSAGWQTAEVR